VRIITEIYYISPGKEIKYETTEYYSIIIIFEMSFRLCVAFSPRTYAEERRRVLRYIMYLRASVYPHRKVRRDNKRVSPARLRVLGKNKTEKSWKKTVQYIERRKKSTHNRVTTWLFCTPTHTHVGRSGGYN